MNNLENGIRWSHIRKTPRESALFYLDNLDRHRRAIQWTKRGAPELYHFEHVIALF